MAMSRKLRIEYPGQSVLTTDTNLLRNVKSDTCLVEVTSRQQQTQRTLLDWLREEYAIEKPSAKQKAETLKG